MYTFYSIHNSIIIYDFYYKFRYFLGCIKIICTRRHYIILVRIRYDVFDKLKKNNCFNVYIIYRHPRTHSRRIQFSIYFYFSFIYGRPTLRVSVENRNLKSRGRSRLFDSIAEKTTSNLLRLVFA